MNDLCILRCVATTRYTGTDSPFDDGATMSRWLARATTFLQLFTSRCDKYARISSTWNEAATRCVLKRTQRIKSVPTRTVMSADPVSCHCWLVSTTQVLRYPLTTLITRKGCSGQLLRNSTTGHASITTLWWLSAFMDPYQEYNLNWVVRFIQWGRA